jgi:5'-3' exonuclease
VGHSPTFLNRASSHLSSRQILKAKKPCLLAQASRAVAGSTARGVGRPEVVDESVVTAKYAIPGRAYAAFATLRGDPSDGLPGVAGVGDKTAATLVSRFGDIDGLLAAVDDPTSDLAPTLRRKLADARDYLAVAPLVVAVRTDVPVPEIDTKLPSEPRDPEALVELGEQWNLDSSLNRVLTAVASVRSR